MPVLRAKFSEFDHDTVYAASLGGAVMAGGEGGSFAYGRLLGAAALSLGRLRLVDLEDFPDDALLICVSLVGAPSSKKRYLEPAHHVRALEKFIKYSGLKIDGIIANGYGAASSLNGWVQSVALGIPLVDALCNGRNSPASMYGSMGLHLVEDYESLQMGVGGDPAQGAYVELFVSGTLNKATTLIRKASVECGGGIAVARNPVSARYAKENATANGVTRCMELGKRMMRHAGDIKSTLSSICSFLNGYVLTEGRVNKFNFSTMTALDCGLVSIVDQDNNYTINFINQYMSVDHNGALCADFPDLIILIDHDTCMPISSSDLREGQYVSVIIVPRDALDVKHNLDINVVYEQIGLLTRGDAQQQGPSLPTLF